MAITTYGKKYIFYRPNIGLFLQAGKVSQKVLVLKEKASQTGNIFEIQNSSGTAVVSIDASANSNPYVYINDSARTATGGGRILRVFAQQATGALTGTMEAIYSRAENDVASMTGKIVGVSAYAANTAASASGTVHGADIWALSKGVNIGTIRGAEIGLDFDGGETVTEATVLRLTSQAAGTVTSCYGLDIVDDSASSPGGKVFDAFIKFSITATTQPNALMDASDITAYGNPSGSGDAADFVILKFKNNAGTTKYLIYDDSAGGVAVV